MKSELVSQVPMDEKQSRLPLWRVRLAFSALATLGVAACGGGGGDPAPTAAPTTAPATAGTPAAPTPPAPAPAPPAPAPAPAPSAPGLDGIWVELQGAPSGFGGGLLRHVLVDTSGRLWGIPNATFGSNGAQAHVLEALQGDVSVTGGTVIGSFFDINTKTCGPIYTCQVSGLLTANQLTLAGSKTALGASLPDFSFSGTRDPTYATQAGSVERGWHLGYACLLGDKLVREWIGRRQRQRCRQREQHRRLCLHGAADARVGQRLLHARAELGERDVFHRRDRFPSQWRGLHGPRFDRARLSESDVAQHGVREVFLGYRRHGPFVVDIPQNIGRSYGF